MRFIHVYANDIHFDLQIQETFVQLKYNTIFLPKIDSRVYHSLVINYRFENIHRLILSSVPNRRNVRKGVEEMVHEIVSIVVSLDT
jgi:hypothetical protein